MKFLGYFKSFCIFLLMINILLSMCTGILIEADEENTTVSENDLYAKAAILIDADSKRVLFEKNAYEELPMASTTKIMTCLVALENSLPETVVSFSTYASSMPKVKLGASKGSEFYMKDMLYSLMLESHNDTAVAIAETIAGSEEEFAKLMNRRAMEMGLEHTNFVTANGLDSVKHYTTAYDLAIIASYAIENEEFVNIINTNSYNFTDLTGENNYNVNNKNAFLTMMEGAMGIKTGYTGKAGYCFVGAVKRNNKTLISVVLGSGWPPQKKYKWKDTILLMNYGLNNFEHKNLFNSIWNYKCLKVIDGIKKEVDTYILGNYDTLVSDEDVVEYEYEFSEYIKAPVELNQVVGKIIIKINGTEYAKFDICTKEKIGKKDFKYCLKKIINIILL